MSKSILIIDTPENCTVCPLLNGSDECTMQDPDANFKADSFDNLKAGCPLKKVPKNIDKHPLAYDPWKRRIMKRFMEVN